ncbi:polysaccharide export outer membrane protein [Granulicella pectinivorans]|jgi:polysaccharide export outer membrane protein|uniref:Polysaccharide export outer membrane protein n=1 Tax=Granulicella pectinivorans TaxID=474950 RepID=A0A1I6LUC5_9BACT|nr:polysaccharide biosynthesis/export family protein [Granulicella pectinivorans]SFS07071.1 polysaccharide export outer membrane protein [Granulicella pectinivorans]
MMLVRRCSLMGMVLIAGLCQAQDAAPGLQMNREAVLKAFEPAADQPYQLGRGDEISVDVIGRPELTGKHTIGPDGNITMPIVGSVKVVDQTREGAAEVIKEALGAYYAGMTVSIGVDKYSSNKILLLGAVEHPGILLFDGPPTLLEVISRGGAQLQAGGGSGGSGGGSIDASPSTRPIAVPEECMIYRGNETMITVQLRSLLDEGNALANMRLKRDDVVYVPGQTKYVSILGMVARPGNMRLDAKSTLPQLLAQAGGVTELAGKNPKIQIIHRGVNGQPGRTQEVAYKDMLTPRTLDLSLQTGDIILVPESTFNGLGYAFAKISPLVQLFTVSSLLH